MRFVSRVPQKVKSILFHFTLLMLTMTANYFGGTLAIALFYSQSSVRKVSFYNRDETKVLMGSAVRPKGLKTGRWQRDPTTHICPGLKHVICLLMFPFSIIIHRTNPKCPGLKQRFIIFHDLRVAWAH